MQLSSPTHLLEIWTWKSVLGTAYVKVHKVLPKREMAWHLFNQAAPLVGSKRGHKVDRAT